LGGTGTATLTVTYNPIPTVTITQPTTAPKYTVTGTNANVSIAGTASDPSGIASVAWSTDQGESGTCTGTTAWSVNAVPLKPWNNVITVTATDTGGNTATATLTVNYDVHPVVAFTQPTTAATYTVTGTSGIVNIGGTASAFLGLASVTWASDQGGSGTCTGTTAWSAGAVPLQPGKNVLTVTATDTAGNIGTAVLTVTYNPIPTLTITQPTTAAT
jgi:hypothetical protein